MIFYLVGKNQPFYHRFCQVMGPTVGNIDYAMIYLTPLSAISYKYPCSFYHTLFNRLLAFPNSHMLLILVISSDKTTNGCRIWNRIIICIIGFPAFNFRFATHQTSQQIYSLFFGVYKETMQLSTLLASPHHQVTISNTPYAANRKQRLTHDLQIR